MPGSIHTTQLTRLQPPRLLVAAACLSAVLVAGCGGSSTGSTASTGVGSKPSAGVGSPHSASTGDGQASSVGAAPAAGGSPALEFAKCMRANGVPNFPDPVGTRGFVFSAQGIDPAAPAVKAAQAKCHRFVPAGPAPPGSKTHPSAQTLRKLLRIAVCMRAHGVAQFPDPRTSVPSNAFSSGISEITNFDGVILLFPRTLNLQAPAYRQALTACGAPPLGLPH